MAPSASDVVVVVVFVVVVLFVVVLCCCCCCCPWHGAECVRVHPASQSRRPPHRQGTARIQEPQTKTTATSTTTKATTTTTTTTTAEAHRLLSQRAAARDFGSESRSRNSWTRGAHLHLHYLCGFLEDTCGGPGASGEMRASASLAKCRGPQPHGRSGADR
ncbi:unnamed protein product [Polarella glacialis]|uniref:Secreted protein n=1 Tax=Polarella glacialis TaxID=89957 RepID=A0A813ELU6_POLGL|nr:unnamed protein product [Polarella glacialis]